jgi:ABC-2 type transport system permease protein
MWKRPLLWLRIARHEWYALAAENKPWVVVLLLAIVTGYTVANATTWASDQQSTIHDVLATNPIENPHGLLQGHLDLAFVVIYLVPLLMIALGYDAVRGEHDIRSSVLLPAPSIAACAVVTAKIAVRVALVAAPLVVFAVLAIVVGGINVTESGTAAQLAAWMAAVAAYAAFWFGALLLVTSLGMSALPNALWLLALWLLVVGIVPPPMNAPAAAAFATGGGILTAAGLLRLRDHGSLPA